MIKENTMKVTKTIISYFFILCISIIFCAIFPIEKLIDDYDKNLFIVSWIINILFVINVYNIYKIKRNIFDFNIVFLVFLFVFCNGQLFLYSIGVKIDDLIVIKVSTKNEILKAAFYFYFSMLFFSFGTLIGLNRNEIEINEHIEDEILSKSIYRVGFALLVISIVPYIYILVPKMINSILYGYNYLYSSSIQNSNFISYLSKLMVPSVFMIMYGRVNLNKKNIHLIIFFAVIIICCMITGARGDALSILIALLIFKNQFEKKFIKKDLLKLAAIFLIIFISIPITASFRRTENKSISGFVEVLSENLTGKDNFFVDTVSELGYTMHSLILTEQLVPNYINYQCGRSYLSSIVMIIPSGLLGTTYFADNAALDIWLQKVHKLSYGPGFSLIAETYYNFGWYAGVIFSFFLGLFFSKIFDIRHEKKDYSKVLQLLSFIFLYNSLLVARFPFHSIPRNLFYMFLIPYILIQYDYKKSKTIERYGT